MRYNYVLTLHLVKTRRASRSWSDNKGFPSTSGSIRPDSAVMNRYVACKINFLHYNVFVLCSANARYTIRRVFRRSGPFDFIRYYYVTEKSNHGKTIRLIILPAYDFGRYVRRHGVRTWDARSLARN